MQASGQCAPQGWKAERARRPVWPESVCRHVPCMFQSLAVPSADAVAYASAAVEGAPFSVATSALGCHLTSVQRCSCACMHAHVWAPLATHAARSVAVTPRRPRALHAGARRLIMQSNCAMRRLQSHEAACNCM